MVGRRASLVEGPAALHCLVSSMCTVAALGRTDVWPGFALVRMWPLCPWPSLVRVSGGHSEPEQMRRRAGTAAPTARGTARTCQRSQLTDSLRCSRVFGRENVSVSAVFLSLV